MNISKASSETVAATGDIITYTITLNVTAGPANFVTVTDTLPKNLSFVSFGPVPAGGTSDWNPLSKTMTFTFSSLSVGTYQLTYQTQVDSFVTEGVVLRNGAQVTYGGLPVPKQTAVNVTMATSYVVHVGVYNEAGELVKEIWVQELSQEILNLDVSASPTIVSLHGQFYLEYKGQAIATWDGTNSSGDPVSNGKYYVKVDNVDSMGVVNSVSQVVTVSRSIAKVQVNIFNEAGEIVRHLYSYMDDPTSNPLANISLSASVIQPSETGGAASTVSIVSASGMTLVWDGRSDSGAIVTNGQYQVEIHAADGKGGDQVMTKSVMVQSGNLPVTTGNVRAKPSILEGGNTLVTLVVDANIPLTLAAHLYDVAGELLRSNTGNAGDKTVTLDGSGLASGLYFVVVELTNAQGGSAGRQVTQIIIRK